MDVVGSRALYVCRHCQSMLYMDALAPTKPPCPHCLHIDYDAVSVPAYTQASQAITYMLTSVNTRWEQSAH
jgi:hypothetical protein